MLSKRMKATLFVLSQFALEKIYDLSFKPYKTTKTHAFFVSILMISFFVSIATFGFVVAKLDFQNIWKFARYRVLYISFSYSIKPSSFCGPFRSLSTIWLVFVELVEEFPRNLRRFIFLLGNPPFNLLVFFILMYVLKSVVVSWKKYCRNFFLLAYLDFIIKLPLWLIKI